MLTATGDWILKTYIECIPCLLRQTSDALGMSDINDSIRQNVMRNVLKEIAEMQFDVPPPYLSGRVHRLIRELTGIKDPYALVKKKATGSALGMVESVSEVILESVDPFEAAVRFSIAGNILDFGAFTRIDDEKIERTVKNALSQDMDTKCLREFKAKALSAKSILFIGDNAGETVFDSLLIKRLPAKAVRYAVKSGPVINDATMEDALAAGIDKSAGIIETGSDMPGTVLEDCSPDFLRIFDESDIVIAKGQANYETLEGCSREVFHLMQVKCQVIARDTGLPAGTWIAAKNKDLQVSLRKARG